VRVSKVLWIVMMASVVLCSGLSPSASAARDKFAYGSPHPHYKVKKNDGPFGGKYLAPKKQRRPTGYYRSTLTGQMVYGKPK
jgi:hypothetical protein